VSDGAEPPTPPPTDDQPSRAAGDATNPENASDELVAARRQRELRELRTAQGQLIDQVATLAAQLGTVTEQLARTGRQHADLAAAVSEDLAPQVGALRQMVSEELGQLRGAVDVLLAERKEREKTKNAPVDWALLTAEQAAVQWPVLARWVGEVLVPRYELTRDELPDCWALHLPAVAEMSWLRTAYVQAYLSRSAPQLAADWHTRWRPAVLSRIRELIKPEECSPGRHAPPRVKPVEAPARDGVNGALPRGQPAEPMFWWPFYDRAVHLDLAARRARAGAGDLDWSPAAATT
jgi:hypothetical protein